VIVAVTGAAALDVATVKFVEVAPAGMVTEAGTIAFELLDAMEITVPPGPAVPFSVTVPTTLEPPPTELGETVMLVREAAAIESDAVCVFGP